MLQVAFDAADDDAAGFRLEEACFFLADGTVEFLKRLEYEGGAAVQDTQAVVLFEVEPVVGRGARGLCRPAQFFRAFTADDVGNGAAAVLLPWGAKIDSVAVCIHFGTMLDGDATVVVGELVWQGFDVT